MSEWNDFFVATAGAAAALTGLIFVGVSISLSKILSTPTLPERALISLILLFTIMILSLLSLVPGQSNNMLGIEVLLLGIIVWAAISKIDITTYRKKEKQYKRYYITHMVFNQFAILPYFVGAIIILSVSARGMYWIVLAIIFSFIKAVMDAWVLLIEINR
jgi:hypothetical protein